MEIRVCAARQVGRRPGSSRKWSANCKTRSCFLCAHLVDALVQWLPLEVDAAAVTPLLEDHGAGTKRYQLSTSGHVSLRAEFDENTSESARLQFDGNLRNLNAARKLVEAFKSVYEVGAASGEPDDVLATFRARLVDIDKTR